MRLLIFVVACGFIAAAPAELYGQDGLPEDDPPREPFVIEWWSIDGGGGPSAGGGYELLATVGQTDVGVAFVEDYLIQAGFLAGGDLGLLFVDGFESGNTDRWDITTGGVL